MAVSGLPVSNGPLHAREVTDKQTLLSITLFCTQIARMALRMLEEIRNFEIPHRPGFPLQLRMGAHSGPCCAGVVGVRFICFWYRRGRFVTILGQYKDGLDSTNLANLQAF